MNHLSSRNEIVCDFYEIAFKIWTIFIDVWSSDRKNLLYMYDICFEVYTQVLPSSLYAFVGNHCVNLVVCKQN
ncbi:hypothetical protein MAR_017527 [Mya arenaria]|uniref:Uncharacterized protein n=1 Tax=Mya arenaria TaxID=6604 RepID=A0ABY7EEQ0_MYAAR|nr:hypothetical protein MAR_017527 [Mya arenaria]